MSDLLNEKEITLDKLREAFHENDFSTLPVRDPSEYNEKELKLYNKVLKYVNAEWKSISKALGLTHPQDCYSKDYPPELIRIEFKGSSRTMLLNSAMIEKHSGMC